MREFSPPPYVSRGGSLLRSLGAMAQAGGQYFKGIHLESLRQKRLAEAETRRRTIQQEDRKYNEERYEKQRADRKEDSEAAMQAAEKSNRRRLADAADYRKDNPSHKGVVQAVGPDGVLRYYKQNTNGDLEPTDLSPASSLKQGKGPGGKPQNATQLKVEGYLSRMENASKLITEVPYDSSGIQGFTDKMLTKSDATNAMASSEGQQYKTLAAEWIRAKLRKESGAVIGVEEMAEEFRTYFPQPGDKEDVIKYKAKLRKHAEESLRLEAGKGGGMSKPALSYVEKYLNGG